MRNTKQTKACAARNFAPLHSCKICHDAFLTWCGTGFELGDASGGGGGGRRKEGHSGLGMEQFSHYTALIKGCHTKQASSCAFVFVGIFRTIKAQTSRRCRLSHAAVAMGQPSALYLHVFIRGKSQTQPLAGLCKGRPSCLRSGLLLDRYWVQCTLLLLRIKPVALSRTPLNPSLACGQKQGQALSELLHDYFSLCSLTRVCTGFLNFQHHDNTCKYLFYSLLVV